MAVNDYFVDSNDMQNEDEYAAREAQTREAMRRRFGGHDAEVERQGGYEPTLEQLTPQYSMEDPYAFRGPERSEMGGARGEDSSVLAALRMLQQQAGTQGFTDAERGMMDASQRAQAQMARSQREALQQQAEARGMGGSGLSFLSSQQAGEAATQRQADFQAQMAMAAQQRALQAMQSLGGLGQSYYGESFNQDATRRSAIDDFNRWQTEYQRDVAARNAQRRDAAAEGRAGAYQQRYQNAYQRTRDEAGDRGAYGDAITGERRYQQERDDARAQKLLDTGTATARAGMSSGGG